MTETLSSLWHSFGGMSLKDEGVDATIFLCSSGVTKVGKEVMRVAAGIVAYPKESDHTDNTRTQARTTQG